MLSIGSQSGPRIGAQSAPRSSILPFFNLPLERKRKNLPSRVNLPGLVAPGGQANLDAGGRGAPEAGRNAGHRHIAGGEAAISAMTKIAVAKICGDGKRVRTRAFSELISHYLFQDRFGRPGKGNDKGKVENLVKNGRLRFLTPVPSAESFEALNAKLEADCLKDLERTAGYHTESIGKRLEADLDVFRPLPAAGFEACEKRTARVSSTALVRYRTGDYSVPTAYGHQSVAVKGFVDQVVITCAGKEIACHKRSYEEGAFVCDPLHYLALIEQKPGALDQARPLQGWVLPEQFLQLRRLLEARMGNRGKREFIQVLRLMEVFDKDLVADAVKNAIKLGAPGFDAVKQLILCRIERRPAHLDLDSYPHLPKPSVGKTRAADYSALLEGAAA
jgi:hypothetical protein